jgi:hypothetical protein
MLSTVRASELGKGVTPRAKAINHAMSLAGPQARKAQAKALKAEHAALHAALLASVEPKNPYAWVDDVLKS